MTLRTAHFLPADPSTVSLVLLPRSDTPTARRYCCSGPRFYLFLLPLSLSFRYLRAVFDHDGPVQRRTSMMLGQLFPMDAIVPSSHASKGIKKDELEGHDADWWDQYQVMSRRRRSM